jgi:PAS domain S-box-containing protein
MTTETIGHRILVADDDPMNVKLLKKLLSSSGYETYTAMNGAEAVKAAIQELPDLILLDVMMPEMDGIEACRHLKANPQTQNIPVIFISGAGNERMGLQSGAVDYIRKPFSPAIIKARVKNHLELKQHRDYLESLVRARTLELEAANLQLQNEITIRRQAEAELRNYQDHLEDLVEKRTGELSDANARLEQEILERRQAEEQVRKSEEKYRSVFENTGSATVILEKDMTIVMANAECEKLTGFSKNEIERKKKWTDLLAPEDLERITAYHGLIQSGSPDKPSEYECRIIDRRGQVKHIFVKMDIIPETSRSVASWIDITDRKRSETALKENECYLRTIMTTIQTGLLIIDPETKIIMDANPFASHLTGYPISDIIGKEYNQYVRCDCGCGWEGSFHDNDICRKGESCDCVLQHANGSEIHVRRSYARAKLKNHEYVVQSFLDITDIKKLLKKQDINIDLSRNILHLINHDPPRYTPLSEGLALYFDAIAIPCHKQGGDHYFLRNLSPELTQGNGRTILSLKDQSGHEVGCVLRSIITDLIYHSLLNQCAHRPLEEVVSLMNCEICHSDIFSTEDFFTSVNVDLDHETLILKYISAGHPPFILIRDKTVQLLPETGKKGANIPLAFLENTSYSAGELQLKPGDRLLFYTDGLTEMPVETLNQTIGSDKIKAMVEEIVRQDHCQGVSDIMESLLNRISSLSGVPVNAASDDITLLCMELENEGALTEIHLTPRSRDDLLQMVSEIYEKIEPEWKARGFLSPEIRLWTILEEGLLNAWRHGNQENFSKTITVRWRWGNDFHLEIADQGKGFEPMCVEDPTSCKNITRSSGRGIFMICHFSDSVQWKEKGRCIAISFQKNPERINVRKHELGPFMNLWER